MAAAVALTAGAAAGVTVDRGRCRLTAPAAVVVKSRGGDVRQLQRAIGVSADGVFGPATERALKRWQRAHGLTADGIAGPNTRAALGLGAGPVLKRKRAGGGSGTRARRSGGHRPPTAAAGCALCSAASGCRPTASSDRGPRRPSSAGRALTA